MKKFIDVHEIKKYKGLHELLELKNQNIVLKQNNILTIKKQFASISSKTHLHTLTILRIALPKYIYNIQTSLHKLGLISLNWTCLIVLCEISAILSDSIVAFQIEDKAEYLTLLLSILKRLD